MSSGIACRNPEHRARWMVTARRMNRSAFNGYRVTPSAYSQVCCPVDDLTWRTKAAYVDTLPNAQRGEGTPSS